MAKDKVKKKDGTLTKKYRDLPRYPVIFKYEDDFKNSFKGVMGVAMVSFKKELKKKLISNR
tara:strand:- start:104124 stop:104306 length:183 start_codon:yes stop_codon:yes gene_type:complete